jgi:serine/threonine protein kinase
MICPRCSVAEISPDTSRCILCGYVADGAVAVRDHPIDEVLETVRRELHDRFELQALLRRERRSSLYHARELEADRMVTVRLIHRPGPIGAEALQHFAQAAALAGRLQHPHVVPILAHGVTQSLVWCAMEAVKGRCLGAILERSGPMDLSRCQALLEQVASGLEYLHRHGLVHGALSPATILVDADGWVRITDAGTLFPLARHAGTGSAWWELLDPGYVAPETQRGHVIGPAADQLALGLLALRCLTGATEPATEGNAEPQPAGPPPRLADLEMRLGPGLPPHVPAAIARAVREDARERFGGVLDFVSVLGGASVRPSTSLATPSSTDPPVVVVPTAESHGRWGRRLLATLGLLVVAAGAGLGGWVAFGRSQPNPATPQWVDVPPAMRVAPQAPAASPTPAPANPVTPPPVVTQPAPVVSTTPSPAVAALWVNATPWGAVYLDGELLGNTPRANVRVPAGTHVLRVVRDGYAPYEREIALEPGQALRILDIVLRPLHP